MLICPICKGDLKWNIFTEDAERIYEGEAVCTKCKCTFPIHNQIASFLKPKYNDRRIWEKCDRANYKKMSRQNKERIILKTESELTQKEILLKIALIENHEIACKNEDVTSLYEMYFKNQGMNKSLNYIYKLISRLLEEIEDNRNNIVLDFASGRGLLARELARKLSGHLIVSDINPIILEKCIHHMEADSSVKKAKISYIVFDMKVNPFKDRGIDFSTTLFGMQNILHTQNLLYEIARITEKKFYSISSYCNEESEENIEMLKKSYIYDVWIRDRLIGELKKYGFFRENKLESFSEIVLPPKGDAVSSGFAVTKFPCVETEIEYTLDEFEKDRRER